MRDLTLSQACGVNPHASCNDVVFITDSESNVCSEVACPHNRLGVNTFAIRIGDIYQPELDCIAKSTSFGHFAFKLHSVMISSGLQ